jgi:hypothetical protein
MLQDITTVQHPATESLKLDPTWTGRRYVNISKSLGYLSQSNLHRTDKQSCMIEMYSFISILWLRLSGDGTSLPDLISFAILHFKVIFKRTYRYDISFRSSSGIIQGRHSSPKRTIIVSNSLDAEFCILYEAYLINRTLWELTLIPSSSHPLLLHSHVLLF